MQVSQVGGARLDNFNASYPFAKLTATPIALELTCFNRRYIFPKKNILRISVYRGFVSVGLRIEHRIPSYPRFVVFWASIFSWNSGYRRLQDQLEMLGYVISH